jgi:hypothetical protein
MIAEIAHELAGKVLLTVLGKAARVRDPVGQVIAIIVEVGRGGTQMRRRAAGALLRKII